MNYKGVHEGYIDLHQRDDAGVSFTLKTSNSVTGVLKGVIGFVLAWPFLLIFSLIGGIGLGLVGALIGIALPFWIIGKKLTVTATTGGITLGKQTFPVDSWEGFLLKEAQTVSSDKAGSETYFPIFYRLDGVDYATKYHLSKSTQDAEIINQMNMLVTEALSVSQPQTASETASSNTVDEWE